MFFEIGAHCATLTVLGVTLWTRLASSSEISLPLPPQVLVLKVKLLPSNLKIYFFIVLPMCVCMYGVCICVCARARAYPPHTHTYTHMTCLVPTETRRGLQVPWVAMWILEIKPGSS